MENTKKVTVSIGEILYWLFFGSLLFAKGIGLYDGQAAFKLVLVFSCLCLMAKLAIEKYTVPEMIKIIAVIGLTGITYIVSGEKGLFLYGLMMVGMKYVDIKRLFAVGTIIWTIAFCSLTISSLFHLADTAFKVHDKLGMGHIFRWALGYSHPNVLHVSYIVLSMFFIYLIGEKFRIKHAIYLFAGNCLVFLYSVSYTGFLIFMCLIGGRIYLLLRKKPGKVEKLSIQMVFPCCVILSLIFPLVATGKIFDVVNKILNTRLALAKYYLTPEFISLFGKRVSEITSYVLTMDNAYLFAFISYGIISFSVLCVATEWLIYSYVKEEKYLELLIILTIAIGGLTEPFLYNTSFKNLSFVFLGSLLFSKKGGRKEYNLFSFKWISKLNKNISYNICHLNAAKEKLIVVFKYSKMKLLMGLTGGFLAIIIGYALLSYPEGYIIRRVDCADISEEIHYYKGNGKFANYRVMGNIADGEEVEFFDGNIVIMEKVRNLIIVSLTGFGVGYLAYGFLKDSKNKSDNANTGE